MDSLHQQPQSPGIPHGILEIFPDGQVIDLAYILYWVYVFLMPPYLLEVMEFRHLAGGDNNEKLTEDNSHRTTARFLIELVQ